VAGCCKHGDERLGSGATELVSEMKHFSGRLHSIAVILDRLVAIQREGKASTVLTDQKTLCMALFAPLIQVHTAHTVRATQTCYSERKH
jgi:hypothetical protein